MNQLPPQKETQDYRRLCEQVERETESKKLAALIERVKRQLADQSKSGAIRVA